jgi:hypothetical protein
MLLKIKQVIGRIARSNIIPNLPRRSAIEISSLAELLMDWPKPVWRKIARINNFSTTTKKSRKTKRSRRISTHMSPRVTCFEIMALQQVSILPEIIMGTWIPENHVNLEIHLMLNCRWTSNSKQIRNSRENFQLAHFLEDMFELPTLPFRPSKYSQNAVRVAGISRTIIGKLDNDLGFTF